MLQFTSSVGSPSKPVAKHAETPGQIPPNRSSSHIFTSVDDDLRDAMRVHSHGQEEDLRLALSRVIDRVSELSTLLKDAYKSQTELENSLNLCKSNLQLVIANNEMLEEALRRDHRVHSKDLGWRRPSARERSSEEQSRRSEESGSPALSAQNSPQLAPVSASPSPVVPSVVAPTPSTHESSRFWSRFSTNGSGSRSASASRRPKTPSPVVPNGSKLSTSSAAHLTSASLPSLAPTHNKELEELQAQLELERAMSKKAGAEKAALEAEIESLSQALFEEANKMVATERIKRAETEEELKEALLEREALRSALQIVESENGRLRGSTFLEPSHSRNSSIRGIKSPRVSTPDSRSSVEETEPVPAPLPSSLPPEPSTPPPPSASTIRAPEAPSTSSTDSAGTYSTPPETSMATFSIPVEESPWADTNPSPPLVLPTARTSSLFAAAALAHR